MQTKQINDIQNKPVIHLALEPTEILGYNYFSNLYSNIYICSKRKSGKTTIIYNILKLCVSKRTNVVFFCTTIHRDSTYKKILEMLEKKKVNVVSYDHFIDGKEKILNSILVELNESLEAEEEVKIRKPEWFTEEITYEISSSEEMQIQIETPCSSPVKIEQVEETMISAKILAQAEDLRKLMLLQDTIKRFSKKK